MISCDPTQNPGDECHYLGGPPTYMIFLLDIMHSDDMQWHIFSFAKK